MRIVAGSSSTLSYSSLTLQDSLSFCASTAVAGLATAPFAWKRARVRLREGYGVYSRAPSVLRSRGCRLLAHRHCPPATSHTGVDRTTPQATGNAGAAVGLCKATRTIGGLKCTSVRSAPGRPAHSGLASLALLKCLCVAARGRELAHAPAIRFIIIISSASASRVAGRQEVTVYL
eukprot:scaffold1280_cov379-Prasinococcus_capsulatus_cf.AAC.12